MEKEVNRVHLEGILEAFQILGKNNDKVVAWASVVTLHPKKFAFGEKATASERFDLIHHDVRVVGRETDMEKLEGFSASLDSMKNTSALLPCSVDGVLSSEGKDTFVLCWVDNLQKSDLVKTNDNNRVEFSGRVLSVSESGNSALMTVSAGNGNCEVVSFIPRSSEAWSLIHSGKIKRGDTVSLSGPLLSCNFTDGKKNMRIAMVSPHSVKKLDISKKIGKSGHSL